MGHQSVHVAYLFLMAELEGLLINTQPFTYLVEMLVVLRHFSGIQHVAQTQLLFVRKLLCKSRCSLNSKHYLNEPTQVSKLNLTSLFKRVEQMQSPPGICSVLVETFLVLKHELISNFNLLHGLEQ